MNDQNNLNRNQAWGMGPWIIGAIVAAIAVISFMSFDRSTTNTVSTNQPIATSPIQPAPATTGSGSTDIKGLTPAIPTPQSR